MQNRCSLYEEDALKDTKEKFFPCIISKGLLNVS